MLRLEWLEDWIQIITFNFLFLYHAKDEHDKFYLFLEFKKCNF